MKNITILSIAIFLMSCTNNTSIESEVKKEKDSMLDTLKLENNIVLNDHNLLNSYNVHFGIAVQSYYEVKDFLPFDINSDGIIDTLAIFSPLVLENPEYFDLSLEEDPKRLLVEILVTDNSTTIGNIYPNLISNIGGTQSKFNRIEKIDDGVQIVHESGAKYTWEYYVVLSNSNQDGFTIKRIKKKCSINNEGKDEEYSFENLSIEEFNITDTITANCGCDSIWEAMSKTQ